MTGLARRALSGLIRSVASVQKALSGLFGVFPIFFERIVKFDPNTLEAATRRAAGGGMVFIFAVLAHAFFLGWIALGARERQW